MCVHACVCVRVCVFVSFLLSSGDTLTMDGIYTHKYEWRGVVGSIERFSYQQRKV